MWQECPSLSKLQLNILLLWIITPRDHLRQCHLREDVVFYPIGYYRWNHSPAIKNIAFSAFLNDLNERAIRIEFPIITLSEDFTFEGQAGKYLNVPNARLWLGEDGVKDLVSNKAEPFTLFRGSNNPCMILFRFLSGWEKTKTNILNIMILIIPYNATRSNITKINYTLNGDMANVSWYWILTAEDASNNTVLMGKSGQQDILKKENGKWVFYGNQEKVRYQCGLLS